MRCNSVAERPGCRNAAEPESVFCIACGDIWAEAVYGPRALKLRRERRAQVELFPLARSVERKAGAA